jgi:hypothetical protein
MGMSPKRFWSQSAWSVVVGVEPVAVGRQAFDDDLNVLTGEAGHLVADQLRLLGQVRHLPDRAAQLV